jgi:hypothetical protein
MRRHFRKRAGTRRSLGKSASGRDQENFLRAYDEPADGDLEPAAAKRQHSSITIEHHEHPSRSNITIESISKRKNGLSGTQTTTKRSVDGVFCARLGILPGCTPHGERFRDRLGIPRCAAETDRVSQAIAGSEGAKNSAKKSAKKRRRERCVGVAIAVTRATLPRNWPRKVRNGTAPGSVWFGLGTAAKSNGNAERKKVDMGPR